MMRTSRIWSACTRVADSTLCLPARIQASWKFNSRTSQECASEVDLLRTRSCTFKTPFRLNLLWRTRFLVRLCTIKKFRQTTTTLWWSMMMMTIRASMSLVAFLRRSSKSPRPCLGGLWRFSRQPKFTHRPSHYHRSPRISRWQTLTNWMMAN